MDGVYMHGRGYNTGYNGGRLPRWVEPEPAMPQPQDSELETAPHLHY